MTTTNGGGPEGTVQGQAGPQLNVLAQYVKDLSFENPNAPRSLQQQQAQPQINIQINVNAKPLVDNDYEVDLKIEGRAEVPGLLLLQRTRRVRVLERQVLHVLREHVELRRVLVRRAGFGPAAIRGCHRG